MGSIAGHFNTISDTSQFLISSRSLGRLPLRLRPLDLALYPFVSPRKRAFIPGDCFDIEGKSVWCSFGNSKYATYVCTCNRPIGETQHSTTVYISNVK